jgi:transposase
VGSGALQLSLFDKQDLFEFSSPDYPAERLVACKNPALAAHRAHKREALLVATEASLEKVCARVAAGKLQGEAAIALAAGKVVDKHKMSKHFSLQITSKAFSFTRSQEKIDQEAALDGLYVIRTSVPASKMDAAQCVRNYKSLSNVERAFRSLKTVDLKVRPIHHYREDRVRAHIFLCMLAYYVQWHMQQALAPLLFADEDQASKAQRDPVKPARRSEKALAKLSRKTTDDGLPLHSFRTLLAHMGTIVRNTCSGPKTGSVNSQFQMTTTPDPLQRRALELLQKIAL